MAGKLIKCITTTLRHSIKQNLKFQTNKTEIISMTDPRLVTGVIGNLLSG